VQKDKTSGNFILWVKLGSMVTKLSVKNPIDLVVVGIMSQPFATGIKLLLSDKNRVITSADLRRVKLLEGEASVWATTEFVTAQNVAAKHGLFLKYKKTPAMPQPKKTRAPARAARAAQAAAQASQASEDSSSSGEDSSSSSSSSESADSLLVVLTPTKRKAPPLKRRETMPTPVASPKKLRVENAHVENVRKKNTREDVWEENALEESAREENVRKAKTLVGDARKGDTRAAKMRIAAKKRKESSEEQLSEDKEDQDHYPSKKKTTRKHMLKQMLKSRDKGLELKKLKRQLEEVQVKKDSKKSRKTLIKEMNRFYH
jgi:hypothetical protein